MGRWEAALVSRKLGWKCETFKAVRKADRKVDANLAAATAVVWHFSIRSEGVLQLVLDKCPMTLKKEEEKRYWLTRTMNTTTDTSICWKEPPIAKVLPASGKYGHCVCG